ncbi:hypothetical protein R82526_00759 [Ralstonia mannitolilytica]|uniref:helix-turn-helix domain-containing protein n=1 Tax=Ralstonia mannitolilytica TaxID=105219 RepID=UPI0028F5A5EA|nr:helix-turn-helix transcriptional regulator [Ralstonia mannitolilytica]CAJ0680520.1 hypothetical protein R82526_00759 [Ralstonia mannitolilytica]
MNQNEIRQLNLSLLISEAGTINELAARTGVGRVYISHCKSGFRNIGDDVAHRFEDGMKKPAGWLDIPHIPDGHKMAAADVHSRLLKLPRPVTDVVAALLRLIENPEGGDDVLGQINLAKPRAGKSKGRVVTLKDNDAKNKTSERNFNVPKRR